jgi:hypothetical protein
VVATFKRRGTAIPAAAPVGLSDEFAQDAAKTTQWSAFVRRAGLKAEAPALEVVVQRVRAFLAPVMGAAHAGLSLERTWQPGGPWM